jgi:hypothetical protein
MLNQMDENSQNITNMYTNIIDNGHNSDNEHISYTNLKAAYDMLQADYTVLQLEVRDKNTMIQNLYNDLDDMRDECDSAKHILKTNESLKKDNLHLIAELNEYKKTNEKLVIITKKHENYINSCYKLTNSMSNSNNDTDTDNDNGATKSGDKEGTENDDIIRYELIPNDIVVNWLIDYINNACTFTSMEKHRLIYEYIYSGEKHVSSRIFKNNKWTLRIMLKQFLSYYHPQYCKRIYASEDIQNSQCMICYSEVVDPCILTCKCKYIYCYKCINKWINKQKNNCPCCDTKTTLIEAGPITPIHLKMIIDRQQSVSSIPQHLKILD